ncbi:hypothetical protein CC78DRAFT_131438 [Lojkania enalia]|uniref:C2H2-type domain-containing protein n=1 Tax=Lojkania enalia TaxID=147567 RepID=A0A9P4TRI2_9PLEO|nr:hypothetical protein CC78DRAFT_131438 [Didymosphaeria enalia]
MTNRLNPQAEVTSMEAIAVRMTGKLSQVLLLRACLDVATYSNPENRNAQTVSEMQLMHDAHTSGRMSNHGSQSGQENSIQCPHCKEDTVVHTNSTTPTKSSTFPTNAIPPDRGMSTDMTQSKQPNFIWCARCEIWITLPSANATIPTESPVANTNDAPTDGGNMAPAMVQGDQYSIACQYCGKVMRGAHAKGNLTRHQKSRDCTSPNMRRKYICELCGKPYQRSDALKKHMHKRHST